MKKYVKVDCVSTFRQTYMIPWDGLQETNPDVAVQETNYEINQSKW